MSSDIDLKDDRILGAGKVVEGLAALRATALLGGQSVVLDNGREMGIITPLGPRLAGLLASGPTRWLGGRGGERGGRWGRGGGLGLSTEELLLAEAEEGMKPLELGLELGLACEDAAMLGLPVGGLAPGLELLLQAWADRTGAVGDGRSRADRSGQRFGRRRRGSESVQLRDRDPHGMEAEFGGRAVIHGRRV
jgi:hypothetical protein